MVGNAWVQENRVNVWSLRERANLGEFLIFSYFFNVSMHSSSGEETPVCVAPEIQVWQGSRGASIFISLSSTNWANY